MLRRLLFLFLLLGGELRQHVLGVPVSGHVHLLLLFLHEARLVTKPGTVRAHVGVLGHLLSEGPDASRDPGNVSEVEEVLEVEQLGLGHAVRLRLVQEVLDVGLLAARALPRDGLLGDAAGLDAVHEFAEDAAVLEEELEVDSRHLVDHVVDPDEDFILLDGVPVVGLKRLRFSCTVQVNVLHRHERHCETL